LFDTYAFREELYKILDKNGFDKSFLKYTPELKAEGQKLLNIRELFKNLSYLKGIPLNNFIEPLEELYSRGEEFLYEDTIDFLNYLKSGDNKIYILTWGEKEYQNEKIKSCRLDKYIDKVIFAEELKYTLDIDYKNGIFIDDSIRDLEGLYKQKAKQVFKIKRENGKNSKEELSIKEILEFNSLKEIQEYLSQRTFMN